MNKIIFSIRVFLCLLLLSACAPSPVQTPTLPAFTPTTEPKLVPSFEPPPKADLDKSFFSNPRRLGDATQTHELLQPPEASLISLNLVEDEYLVEVVAASGAVPPHARVVIANMETRAFKLFTADDQGGFRETVVGFPGAHIFIKQDSTGRVSAFDSVDNMAFSGFIIAPGIIVQVPFESREDDRVPVVTGYSGRCGQFCASWIFEGNISSGHVRPGETISLDGKVTLFSNGPDTPETGSIVIYLIQLSDETGRQVGSAGSAEGFVSTLLTPTGLPIERWLGADSQGILIEAPLSWQQEGETWTATVNAQKKFPAMYGEGRFLLLAAVYQLEGYNLESPFRVLSEKCCNGTWLGIVEVGDPEPTRLATPLLADVLSEGSRGGVIAIEDKGLFDISGRTVTRHDPVIPRLDAFGIPWSYQLGPFLPMVGGGDRTYPLKPAIDFDFTSGELRIQIQRPDGGMDVIGSDPITRLASNTPITPWDENLLSGGSSLFEVPQLLGDGGAFAYQFPMDGDYIISLDGQINDLTGNEYEISGTYQVTVADVLDIETALLPGTPFEVGDSLPIGLYVMPGLPAEVVYKVTTYYPDGDMDLNEYSGSANAFGWWGGDGQSHLFERPGEYLVEVEARFNGRENLWVGRITFGGVIASPDPAIAMHGRRGPDGLTYLAPVWSFDTDYGETPRAHFHLPYFSGDILWSTPRIEEHNQNPNIIASEAAIVRASIQILDPANTLAQKAVELVEKYRGYQDDISPAELIRGDQIPLFTRSDLSWNPGIYANDMDFWSYLYHAIERPGVRVREIVKGSDLGAEYWRFDDPYHLQSGNGPEGDLPGDFKFMYGGAVLRDEKSGEGEYAIYGSGWVHTEYDDALGGRVMPPFQGAAGGPSGGPLFTIFGTPIDMFFVPLAVRPGMVLELGDTFRMAGPIMPTLPSNIEYTVTSPDGTQRNFNGVANAVGYFYQPGDDFILDQTGEWTVELTVTHDGMTSAGPVDEPYPTGGLLTPDLHTFSFFVVETAADRLPLYTNLSDLEYQPWHYDVATAAFVMPLPSDMETDKVRMVATIPGIVLASEELNVEKGRVAWRLNGRVLNRLVHNLDYKLGLADTIMVTFFAEDGDQVAAGSLVVHGWHVPLPHVPSQTQITFPTSAPDEAIVVTSFADSGPGSLRQAMLDAIRGDVITFDPAAFPPDAPVTIALSSGLPDLNKGNITIDASNAWVILDGSNITDSTHGLSISSDHNIIRGLQITGFSPAGVGLYGGAQYNIIGGDRNVGDGPMGQGNLISGNGEFGIGLWGEDTSYNTIQGNYIGITIDGTATWGHARDGIHSNGATQNLIIGNVIGGNETGVYLCCVLNGASTIAENLIGVGPDANPLGNNTGIIIDRTSHNVVGPGNTIAYNLGDGIMFWEDAPLNIVTQNSVHDNGGRGIAITRPDQITIRPPRILTFDLQTGTVSGVACANCTVEIFSDNNDEGAVYEGTVIADANGAFTFEKGAPLIGPFLTATATNTDGSSSEFSAPVR